MRSRPVCSGGTLAGSDAQTRASAEQEFSGTQAQLQEQQGKVDLDTAWYAVLSADGSLLLADPPADVPATSVLTSDPGFALVEQTHRLSFGDVVAGESPNVRAYQWFNTPEGARIMVIPASLAQLEPLFTGAINVTSGVSYVLDGQERIITSTSSAPGIEPGDALGNPALQAALRTETHGTVDGTYFSAHPVAGSHWQVLMTEPRSTLLGPVTATGRVAWQMFAALAAAILLILVIGVSLSTSASRLARARLHDTLTGLPSRALFMEEAEAAITEWRRKQQTGAEGSVAALFLDLDGFKPVNDTYGHAAGDALLREVAVRLADAVRPDDFVSRFGGDEFLVLCRNVRHIDDANAVADRIRTDLSEPFTVDGHTVTIGVSIGIAVLDEGQEAALLIHNADTALYRAKQNGRGRVEVFTA
ncbi:GGDEF domain-containing protein [Kineosporia rhizophila]|uniref:GGDEF domain-containing protein n=1 Tax=Kineosporia rhizophila TaxID=84633 RepID=UPI001E293CC0|nr:GGDEF domain-containing protein [Kineosporia rhizophila]